MRPERKNLVILSLCALLFWAPAGEAYGETIEDMSRKEWACNAKHPRDMYAVQACLKEITAQYKNTTMRWKGRVRGHAEIVGATATGFGFYASEGPFYFYVELKRGSEAFNLMMDPKTDWGPKGQTWFTATAKFSGWKGAGAAQCGGRQMGCYVPMLQISSPSQLQNDY